MKPTGIWQVVGISCLVVVCAAAFGRFAQAKDPLYAASVRRMEKLVAAVDMYANDWDEFLPLGNNWVDATLPYTRDFSVYHSPAVKKSAFGYALNDDYAGTPITRIVRPSRAVLLFDSADLRRNASAELSSEPRPGRYEGVNTEGFADGHTKDDLTILDPKGDYTVSLGRIKQLALGSTMYSNDWDDNLPFASHWADTTYLYVRRLESYQSPKVQRADPNRFGYAYHAADGGQNMQNFTDPAREILLFDSKKLYWNAADNGQSLPKPGRYQGRNTLAFLDGHSGS